MTIGFLALCSVLNISSSWAADDSVTATINQSHNTFSQLPSSSTKLVLVKTITGQITPKSVLASRFGIVSAHNMMYRHSVTIYDSKTFALLKTIPDDVQLSQFGFKQYSGNYSGAPVEGAFSPDGKYLYVTNYSMYGRGFEHEGHDVCKPSSGFDRSFLYRINLKSLKIDAVYQVGVVPKVVQVTPDNKYILVTNWCSYDLDIISIAEQKLIKRIKMGVYPRGIEVSSDGHTAYVAQMGESTIRQINLKTFNSVLIQIGSNPRAVVLSPDNRTLYATLNHSGRVTSFDLIKRKILASTRTGKTARSLAISSDGSALFVVNFESGTVSKLRASDLTVLQKIKVCRQPIGVTYDETTSRTWVACYLGQIKIFDNK